jgi:hypothetical protein
MYFLQVMAEDTMTQTQGAGQTLPAVKMRSLLPKHQQQGFQVNQDKMKQPAARCESN